MVALIPNFGSLAIMMEQTETEGRRRRKEEEKKSANQPLLFNPTPRRHWGTGLFS
jgi:hypothetical protein